jgi:hypothetical protein
MQNLTTCLSFFVDKVDCGLVSRKIERFFAKYTKTDVTAPMSHPCFECCGAPKVEWVLNNPDDYERCHLLFSLGVSR